MNAILHGANTCTPKKQASQLIVELGKSISNPQRQTLANLYIAVDTANSLLNELEQAHQIIRQCMHEMNDEQIQIRDIKNRGYRSCHRQTHQKS
ncbi:Uncharacterised protein [Acinetobacter baumannii]|nr:hypothetical protein [Acinetobacter baumannii]SSQ04471.1 Uncharacterised protein [Acinetobacter baumannii]